MRKIPTVFVRPEFVQRYVTDEVTPGCEWVFACEGTPTRKYDGTCVMFDGERWWARREVRFGRVDPPGFVLLSVDNVTGKRMGWEPVEQSSFARFHAEALANGAILDRYPVNTPVPDATYELLGPRINGNPEVLGEHMLVRHGYLSYDDAKALQDLTLDFTGIASWLAANSAWEGIVWHHPDGEMAKIKRRDFLAEVSA